MRLFVLAILLVSAAAVTKLMAINISSARNIIWSTDDMIGNINTAMQVRTDHQNALCMGVHVLASVPVIKCRMHG